ncbi:MAG: FG-GAP repeat domain-containing protein, partial [Planctomycetota bacterium]
MGTRWGPACFLDMDADGDLDLYAANYLAFSSDTHARVRALATEAMYAIPRHYQPIPDTLYRNNGDGTFTDVSADSGVDSDVFVANDVWENYLFQNDGSGHFEEVGLMAGVAFDGSGQAQAGMGVDCGDYNNDGWLDFYLTNYQKEQSALYKNLGDGMFEDVTFVTGAGTGTLNNVTWGNGFVDFDNDGDLDIFVACGHL